MKRPSPRQLIALSIVTVLAGLALTVPAAAYHTTYQRYCSYTSYGLRCWYQPVVATTQSMFSWLTGSGSTGSTSVQTAPAQSQTTASATATGTQGLTAEESQMLNLVNQERSRAGLRPLQADLQLTRLARMKSQDMITNRYFSHNSPTYGSPFDMLKRYGVSYRAAAENLAGNSTVSEAHSSLMNSSGHRANIMSSQYTHIGIGIVRGGQYGSMFTQLFIGR